jgi:hypothetical protein
MPRRSSESSRQRATSRRPYAPVRRRYGHFPQGRPSPVRTKGRVDHRMGNWRVIVGRRELRCDRRLSCGIPLENLAVRLATAQCRPRHGVKSAPFSSDSIMVGSQGTASLPPQADATRARWQPQYRLFISAEGIPHLVRHGVKKWTTDQIRLLSLKLLGISHGKRGFRIVNPVPRIVGFPTLDFCRLRIIRNRSLNRFILRFLMLQLLLKKLILQSHIFQLLLHLTLLFG